MNYLFVYYFQSVIRKKREEEKKARRLFIYENLETVIIVKLKMLIVLNMQMSANHTHNSQE